MTQTTATVTLLSELPKGVLKPFSRLSVEKLTTLKNDIEYELDSLIERVRCLEADGWKICCTQDEIQAYHPTISAKDEVEKRLQDLDLSHWQGVLVE